MTNANQTTHDKSKHAKGDKSQGVIDALTSTLLRNAFGFGKKRKKEWPHYLPPLG
ncbi:MAG: hypothetical protein AAFQ10_01695 [Pseudomonadota bacterium]